MTRPQPVMFGYQRLRLEQPDRAAGDLSVLRAFAAREGYALGCVYTDVHGTWGALEQLMTRVRSGEAAAVGVASAADLGITGRERVYVMAQIEQTGVPVLVAAQPSVLSAPSHGPRAARGSGA